jgi:hypothetical protein
VCKLEDFFFFSCQWDCWIWWFELVFLGYLEATTINFFQVNGIVRFAGLNWFSWLS